MLSLFAVIIALLGWSYTDASGSSHYDQCFSGDIILYEDMSYRTYSDPYVYTCIEAYYRSNVDMFSDNDPQELSIARIEYVSRDQFMIRETYYKSGECFPNCVSIVEYVLYLNRLAQ